MGLYSTICSLLVLYVSYIVYHRYSNAYSSFISKPNKRYDYIIVGAGTAGCVLAARLSEDPKTTVLLVEAGEHMGYFTKIPLTATAAQQTSNDWSVRTKSQKYSSFGLWDQAQFLPRGKGVGGSGQINFLLHGFGLPEDYDRWSKLGFKMWTRGHLRPYFKKAFGTVRSEFDSESCSESFRCRGWEAPMKLKMINEDNELLTVFQRGSSELSDNSTIFKKATATIKDGARFSVINAYLKPALKRENLHVLTRTKAVSIRFEDKKATSLYILQNHRELDNIFVNKEIIVSAGAIKTPQLMILSGIGPKNLIEKLRIKLISENNNVGRNLHDHMNMPIYVSIKSPISVTLAKVFSFDTVWQYYWNGEGLLSFPPVTGFEYHNNSALILFSMGSSSERLLRDLSNYQPEVFRDTFPFYNDSHKEGFMFLATCVQPKSRGSVTVRDSSTTVPPVVDPNYLHQHFDVKCIINAIRRAERLVSTKPFQEIGAFIHWPRPERCRSLWRYTKEDQRGPLQKRKRRFTSQKKEKPKPRTQSPKALSPPDEYLECIIREVAVTGHHVAGTCSGGTVVDHLLKVKGVTGVRIMDASILPSPLSLFPNSVIIAMAERAVDLIRYNST